MVPTVKVADKRGGAATDIHELGEQVEVSVRGTVVWASHHWSPAGVVEIHDLQLGKGSYFYAYNEHLHASQLGGLTPLTLLQTYSVVI